LKKLQIALSALMLLGSMSAMALGQGASDTLTVPFPFPTNPPTICDTAVLLDTYGARITNVKFSPISHNGTIVGCTVSFTTSDPQHLNPPFKARFTDGSGNTLTLSSDRISSSNPTSPRRIPETWNMIRNVQDTTSPQ
jgi:hypothetical protein